jgi:ribose 5-phosphate isomerase B
MGIASDHAGKELKQIIVEFLRVSGVDVEDFGVAMDTGASVDYPDYASMVASEVSSGKLEAGILVCGTGIGMCMSANKFHGVRAALTWDEYTTRMCREHNDANILCLGARTINHHRAIDLVKTFCNTAFAGDRHRLRLNKLRELEKRNFKVLGE